MTNDVTIDRFDSWLTDESPVAALTMRQWLQPVEGKDAVFFPPTYAKPERMRDDEWMGYNIDRFADGTSVCLIDSVGSQSNRLEPVFKRATYRELVPQVVIKARENEVNLLDAGHRAADAIVRFSSLAPNLDVAFREAKKGNAEPLAKIAPTSLVFGAWDSRATQTKLPRIVRSVVRAFNVKPMHRSAQYIPALDYVSEGLVDEPREKTQKDALSEMGLSHAPATWSHGGITAESDIRRDATLNLVALRALAAGGEEGDSAVRTQDLRRYILGLALVVFTAPHETSLREGCQLVPDAERAAEWSEVLHDGSRQPFGLSHHDALQYARAAAAAFGVGKSLEATFDSKAASIALGQSKEERKKTRRGKETNTKKEAE